MNKPTDFGFGGGTCVRLTGLLACFILASTLASACGGGGGSSAPTPLENSPAALAGNSAAVAEVLAAPVPEGVDPALWETLTQELARELASVQQSRQASDYAPEWDLLQEFACSSELVDGTRYVIWNNGFFQSDGSQNGAVDVADVTPIAMYLGTYCSSVSPARLADYNRDGKVSVADITPLAVHFGEICSGYRVEISTEARRAGYTEVGTVGYREFTEKNENGFGVHRYAVEASVQGPAWAQVWALDADGAEIEWDAVAIAYDRPIGASSSSTPTGHWYPYFPVSDLAVLSTSPAVVTWSSSFFAGDGDTSGNVAVTDVTPLAVYFQRDTSSDPLATCADYDRNGVVDMLDLECMMDHFSECCSGFAVEVSMAGPTDGFWEDGCLEYDYSTYEVNEFGFRVFEYTIQSPPEADSYWVRVTPYDWDEVLGVPCAPVYFPAS